MRSDPEMNQSPEIAPVVAPWARHLAEREGTLPAVQQQSGEMLTQAIAVLWALFDDACTEANQALEAAGVPIRISMQHGCGERRYAAPAAEGVERSLSILVTLPVINGEVQGGASIGSSQSRLSVDLVPEIDRGGTYWIVVASGTRFTARIVHDLFLSTFTDDPEATYRLSPLSGRDLYQTPWK